MTTKEFFNDILPFALSIITLAGFVATLSGFILSVFAIAAA